MDQICPREKAMGWAEIRKRIEEAMSEVAFAATSDFETARQMVQNRKTANKRVLLGTDAAEMNRQFVQYALQLCARLGAGLEIVHLVESDTASHKEKKGFDRLRRSLEEKNIVYQVIACGGNFEEEVEKYTRGRRDILCVVIELAEKEAREPRGMAGRKENKILKTLSCPVVLFESQTGG